MRLGDEARLSAILRTADELIAYLRTEGIDSQRIRDDRIVQWTVTTPLYNIGEHANALSDGFCAAHPEIPWSRIAGLRHRLVHDYEGTNWDIVADTIMADIPALADYIRGLPEAQ